MTTAKTLDQRLDKIDAQLEMVSSAIVKGFDRIDKTLEGKASKDDVARLLDAIDAFAKRQEIGEEERLVMAHQLDRLDKWVHELADKIGVSLST